MLCWVPGVHEVAEAGLEETDGHTCLMLEEGDHTQIRPQGTPRALSTPGPQTSVVPKVPAGLGGLSPQGSNVIVGRSEFSDG